MPESRKTMVDYLLLCVKREDWHGVSDAANDLRVIEAEALGKRVAEENRRCDTR